MAEFLISLKPCWPDNKPLGKGLVNNLFFSFFNFNKMINLPRWACVAFGARCVKRVENLIIDGKANSSAARHRSRIAAVIRLIERAVSKGKFEGDVHSFSSSRIAARSSMVYLPQLGSVFNDISRAVGAVADAMGRADPDNLDYKIDEDSSKDQDKRKCFRVNFSTRFYVVDAAKLVLAAVISAYGVRGGISLFKEMVNDLVLLHKTAKLLKLSDDSPVSLDVFGPLWQCGRPLNPATAKPGRDLTDEEAEKLELDIGDLTIWRYMELRWFMQILETNTLHFTRADCFSDTLEGQVPKGKNIPLGPKIIQQMKREVLVNCWHICDDESAMMWEKYASAGQGIAVQSTIRSVKKAFFPTREAVQESFLKPLQDDNSELDDVRWIRLNLVKYVDHENYTLPRGNFLEHFFVKDRKFAPEREFRLLFQIPQVGVYSNDMQDVEPPFQHGLDLHVNIKQLIKKIIIGPNVSKESFDSIRESVGKSGLNVPMVCSSFKSDKK